jgi:hypothetical protein
MHSYLDRFGPELPIPEDDENDDGIPLSKSTLISEIVTFKFKLGTSKTPAHDASFLEG